MHAEHGVGIAAVESSCLMRIKHPVKVIACGFQHQRIAQLHEAALCSNVQLAAFTLSVVWGLGLYAVAHVSWGGRVNGNMVSFPSLLRSSQIAQLFCLGLQGQLPTEWCFSGS